MFLSRAMSSLAPTLPFLEQRLAYIGGKWCTASDNGTFGVTNPANGEQLGNVANVGRVEAQQAILKADEAFQKWKKTTAKV